MSHQTDWKALDDTGPLQVKDDHNIEQSIVVQEKTTTPETSVAHTPKITAKSTESMSTTEDEVAPTTEMSDASHDPGVLPAHNCDNQSTDSAPAKPSILDDYPKLAPADIILEESNNEVKRGDETSSLPESSPTSLNIQETSEDAKPNKTEGSLSKDRVRDSSRNQNKNKVKKALRKPQNQLPASTSVDTPHGVSQNTESEMHMEDREKSSNHKKQNRSKKALRNCPKQTKNKVKQKNTKLKESSVSDDEEFNINHHNNFG